MNPNKYHITMIIGSIISLATPALGGEQRFFGGLSMGSGKLFYPREAVGLTDTDFEGTIINVNVSAFVYYSIDGRYNLGIDLTAFSEFAFTNSTTTGDLLYSISYWHYLSSDLNKSAPFVRFGIGPSDRSTEKNGEYIMTRA